MRLRYLASHILFLVIVGSAICALAQSASYKVIRITSPFNPSDSVQGSHISNWGWLALNDLYHGTQQAFVWRAGKGTALSLFGGSCSTANGINNPGAIVGGACLPGKSNPHAYLYTTTKTQDLGTFRGVSAEGSRVNLTNQVAGNYQLSDGTNRGFFWQPKGWHDLGTLGGSFTYPFGLNDSAVIAGQSDISNNPDPVYGIPPFHGFQWSNGVLTDFGSIFGSNFNYGNSINNSGLITGSADVAGDTGAHAITWKGGVVQDLTPGGGGYVAWGLDINTHGDVVGAFGQVDSNLADGPPVNTMLCPCYAMLWHNGQSIVLQNDVPSGWSLLLALAINDHGEILARGAFNGGKLELLLLKPLTPGNPQVFGSSAEIKSSEEKAFPAGAPGMLRRQYDGKIVAIQ